jgi:hypothetical protein
MRATHIETHVPRLRSPTMGRSPTPDFCYIMYDVCRGNKVEMRLGAIYMVISKRLWWTT